MAPDLHFELTQDSYVAFEEQLASFQIVVRNTGRQTTEDLERNRVVMATISGVMTFHGNQFHFHRQMDRCGCHLSILLEDHDAASLIALVDVLEEVFPQCTRICVPRPRPWTVRRLSQCLGCIFAIAVFGTVCFLCALGFKTFLGWF
jgi:hypothetical protein